MPLSVSLVCIEPGFYTRQVWPVVRDLIRKAIERTNLSDFEAVERDVLQGRSLLWLALDGEKIHAAATTELTIAQGRKACTVVACSGKGRGNWLHLLSQIEDYAKAEGCKNMRIIGRKGWQNVLSGYDPKFIILEKYFDADLSRETQGDPQLQP